MVRHALLGIAAAVALSACATAPLPPLPSTHPASATAPEAAATPVPIGLANDPASRKTDMLLEKQSTPVTGAPSSMPGMNHQ